MLTIRTPLGEQLLELEEFEGRVRRGEVGPDAEVCFPAVTGDRWVRARELEIFSGLYDPGRIYFRRHFTLSRLPVLTTALVACNVLIFLWFKLTLPAGADELSLARAMVDMGAVAAPLVFDLGQTWRLITANFVHRDVLHLAFNMVVLFNAAGALENAFRPAQLVALLVASALGATGLSLLGSGTLTAGASGIVFGCLGGLVVFGIKYHRIIPGRYRRFFGLAVAPYVGIYLWMGWISAGIDNWGHLGGLLGGAVVTILLRPRLLLAPPPARWRMPALWASIALVVLLVTVAGPGLAKSSKRTSTHRDDASGMVLDHPASWKLTVTHLGELGLGNGLPDPVWVQARVELLQGPIDLSAVADRWLTEQLHRAEQAGRIRSSRWRAAGEYVVAGYDALAYEAAFEVEGGDGLAVDYQLRLYAFARGDIAHSVALIGPVRWFERYREPLYEIVDGIWLDEPAFVRRARAGALLRPGDERARSRMFDALRRAGESDER